MITEIEYCDVPLTVDYDSEIVNYVEYGDCLDVTINDVWVKDVSLLELLSLSQLQDIEDIIREEIENCEEEHDPNDKLENLE